MVELRTRAARHKGQLNFGPELRQMLYAFGDDKDPLDETVRVLDEIVTDFVIETAHTAHTAAEYSQRAKIKNDDFMFAIRKDDFATGRVKELHMMEKKLKEQRTQFDTGEGKVGLERGGRKKKDEKAEEADNNVKGKGKGAEEPVDDDDDLGDADED
ncbi:hypothetical protein ACLMJK_007278 [Lecanora helva]